MAVKQLSHGVWYSTFAGHRFDNQEDAEAFDEKQRGRHPVQSGTPFLDSLSAEQLKAAITELDSEAERLTNRQNWDRVQKEFVKITPAYVVDQVNGNAMMARLDALGKFNEAGMFLGTMEDMQEAFFHLVDIGMVRVKPGVPLPERPTSADLDEAEGMPMAELEMRVRKQNW